jgi:hypothetical protein
MRRHVWLIPVAALLAVALLALGGPSCGKDNGFHLQSWFDAAQQLRHGTLYPRWTFAAAYNSGEPRFTFYPPISWLLGGWLLVFRLPFAAVPIAVAWIALTLAGFAMHRLARRYASADAAMLAACLYLANPFMLFSIVARAAYGEIFAAAFCPLLIAAMLAEQPSAWAIAFPLAGMALSNVPGGILGGYLFLFLASPWRNESITGGCSPPSSLLLSPHSAWLLSTCFRRYASAHSSAWPMASHPVCAPPTTCFSIARF